MSEDSYASNSLVQACMRTAQHWEWGAHTCALGESLIDVQNLPPGGGHIHKEVALLVAVHGALEHVGHVELQLHHRAHLQLAHDQLRKVGQDGRAGAVKGARLRVPQAPAQAWGPASLKREQHVAALLLAKARRFVSQRHLHRRGVPRH